MTATDIMAPIKLCRAFTLNNIIIKSFDSPIPYDVFDYLVSSGLDDFVERVQDVEVQEREEAVLQVEVSTEKATVTWHKVSTVL